MAQPTRRVIAVWLPYLATDRLARCGRSPSAAPPRPRATLLGERGALRLAAVDARAAGLGLVPGLTLADARARVPELQAVPADPIADAEGLARLADWCTRYTPWTATDGCDGLWLDITGCAHLFGGEAALLADLPARLGRLGFTARAGLADTPGTAWALARHGATAIAAAPPGGNAAALAPLPVGALRLPGETVETLDRLGLRRIADLLPLPRPALARRFGAGLAERLDQALGRVGEPISPRRPAPPHGVRLAFAEPIATRADIAALLDRLLAELAAGLEAIDLGARRLDLTLYRVDATLVRLNVGTSRPTRDARALSRLFAEGLDTVDPGFGIESARLDASVVEALVPAQPGLGGVAQAETALAEARDLAPLVDRLINRLGPRAVAVLAPQASHWPERAAVRRPVFASGTAGWQDLPPRDAWTGAPARPLRLLPRPEPIEAVAPVPDDPPLLFRWRRVLHRVARADGPERIAPEWWRGRDRPAEARDYYRVEDAEGRRFWLYRDGLDRAESRARWYLHGLFA